MTQSSSQPSYLPPVAPLPTSGLAIASLVTGILGFMLLPIICSIIAILSGYAARKETRANPPIASGDGLASAGIIMGYIQLGLIAIGLCCFLAYAVFFLGILGTIFGSGHSYLLMHSLAL
jgi:Domain of unknown function (DUF4190)